jgi:hypothetical protein
MVLSGFELLGALRTELQLASVPPLLATASGIRWCPVVHLEPPQLRKRTGAVRKRAVEPIGITFSEHASLLSPPLLRLHEPCRLHRQAGSQVVMMSETARPAFDMSDSCHRTCFQQHRPPPKLNRLSSGLPFVRKIAQSAAFPFRAGHKPRLALSTWSCEARGAACNNYHHRLWL